MCELAHSLKGAAGSLNVQKSAAVFSDLEEIGRTGSMTGAQERIEKARQYTEQL